eukprot:Gb_07344 [translate_table: standard]
MHPYPSSHFESPFVSFIPACPLEGASSLIKSACHFHISLTTVPLGASLCAGLFFLYTSLKSRHFFQS